MATEVQEALFKDCINAELIAINVRIQGADANEFANPVDALCEYNRTSGKLLLTVAVPSESYIRPANYNSIFVALDSLGGQNRFDVVLVTV